MIKTAFQGELEYLEISNSVSEAKIALQGAHIFHFQVKGKEPLLWLSSTSTFERTKAIRGGIPVCWPWFGAHPSDPTLPKHGFARTFLWEHVETREVSDAETRITLRLQSSEESLSLWPFHFELVLEVTIAATLSVSLRTNNCDSKALPLTCALHTYLKIDDIRQTFVEGLDNKTYYNKVDNSVNNLQSGALGFSEETDRVYQDVSEPVQVKSDARLIEIETLGSETVVIWNPGQALAAKMPDLSSHQTMLCVESANTLNDALILDVNGSHCLSSIISIA